ncbi:MAG: SOS response-associated peptidase [Candidatus Binatia bacterium]
MCGRFSRASGRDALAEAFPGVDLGELDFRPRYNVAPNQPVEAIVHDEAVLRLVPMHWGFTPAFAKDPTFAPINARAETVATSPMFRQAFRHGRCLIVADGFYEWRPDGRRKTPYFIRLRSGRPFGFAAIYSGRASPAVQSRKSTVEGGAEESLRAPQGRDARGAVPAVADRRAAPTCAIITCGPNDVLAAIHNRMPVILPVAARECWLDPVAAPAALRTLLAPLPAAEMVAYEVSTWVNSPRHDTPECVRPLRN